MTDTTADDLEQIEIMPKSDKKYFKNAYPL